MSFEVQLGQGHINVMHLLAADEGLGSFVIDVVRGDSAAYRPPLWSSPAIKTRIPSQQYSLNKFTRWKLPSKTLAHIHQQTNGSVLWLRLRRTEGRKVKIIMVGTC